MRTESKAAHAPHGGYGLVQSVPVLAENRLDDAGLHGTVGATLDPIEKGYYRSPSEALTRGAPLSKSTHAHVDGGFPKLHAKDLIAELDSINSTINRIMCQVERAVARLATSG